MEEDLSSVSPLIFRTGDPDSGTLQGVVVALQLGKYSWKLKAHAEWGSGYFLLKSFSGTGECPLVFSLVPGATVVVGEEKIRHLDHLGAIIVQSERENCRGRSEQQRS